MATVYHLGHHRCSLQVDHAKRSRILKKRLEERNPTGSAKEVGLREVGLLIESGEMDMAAAEAENWVDRRAAKRQMEKLLPTAGHGPLMVYQEGEGVPLQDPLHHHCNPPVD